VLTYFLQFHEEIKLRKEGRKESGLKALKLQEAAKLSERGGSTNYARGNTVA
jgi:hypothetical protein